MEHLDDRAARSTNACSIEKTTESAATGGRSLKVGMCLYAKEAQSGTICHGAFQYPEKETWVTMEYRIPERLEGLIEEIGFCFCVYGEATCEEAAAVLVDDLYADGVPSYRIAFEREQEEVWTLHHREVSQFTRLKGKSYLKDGQLHISCCDFGETYTGRHDWKDYTAQFLVTPLVGLHHLVNVRVQGAIRSYAVALLPNDQIAILKNENGYRVLKAADYKWKHAETYQICVTVKENVISAAVNGVELLKAADETDPYLEGAIGLSVRNGSHLACREITVEGSKQ